MDAREIEEKTVAECAIWPFVDKLSKQVTDHGTSLDALHSGHRQLAGRVGGVESSLAAFMKQTQNHEIRLMESIERLDKRIDTLQAQIQQSNAEIIRALNDIGLAVSEYKLNQYQRFGRWSLVMFALFVAYLAGKLDILALTGVVP